MDTPNVLRETKGMQKGFVKEDVLMYLDELNSKIDELQKKANEASGQQPADNQEIIKYRNQIDNLQEKLNASNNALRVAKKENEELQQQIAKLKAGGAAPSSNSASVDSQTKAALEAAKKEIDTLRNQLKAANDKVAAAPAANAGNQAAIDAAIEQFKAGTLHVFDTANFTIGGKAVESYTADVDTDAAFTPDTEVIKDGYFHESEYRSAPYFDAKIDGITLLNEKF